MEQIEMIVKYASVVLSLLVFGYSVFMFIFKSFKQKVKKKKYEDENEDLQEKLEDSQATFKLINEIIPLAIKKAEDVPLIDGQTKKLLAISEVLLSCNNENIDFDSYKDFINEQIENLIAFSKTINKREKDAQ